MLVDPTPQPRVRIQAPVHGLTHTGQGGLESSFEPLPGLARTQCRRQARCVCPRSHGLAASPTGGCEAAPYPLSFAIRKRADAARLPSQRAVRGRVLLASAVRRRLDLGSVPMTGRAGRVIVG